MNAPKAVVVIVDDDEAVRDVFARVLERAGYACHQARDGNDALLMMQRVQADLVLMDIAMPGMDGITTARALRERGYARPIVAVSAHIQREEDMPAIRGLFEAFAAKPIEKDELLRVVDQWAGPGQKQS